MLSIFFIYFIGKQFFNLAEEFNKSKWGIAILGVISYYAGQVLFVILILISDELLNTAFLTTTNESTVNLIGIPIGILSCVGLYFLLRNNWRKNGKPEENLIEEIGKF